MWSGGMVFLDDVGDLPANPAPNGGSAPKPPPNGGSAPKPPEYF